jgi:DNA-binding Xre family transcriptional regulator
MTVEEKLKNLILARYNSVREFAHVAEIPNTTLASIFQRGVNNSSVGNIIKICKVLNLSVDALADGEIVPKYDIVKPISTETTDVKQVVTEAKAKLSHANALTINGQEVDIESIEPIIDALDIGFEMSRRKSHNKMHNKNITEHNKIEEKIDS